MDMRTIRLSASQLAITEQAISIYIKQLASSSPCGAPLVKPDLLTQLRASQALTNALGYNGTYSAIIDERRETALAVRQILRDASASAPKR